MEFSPETALEYAHSISRPRFVGSGGEETVAQLITEQLERSGFVVERQPFEFASAPETFIALEVLASQLLMLAALFARGDWLWVKPVAAAALLLLVFCANGLNRAVRAGGLAPRPGESASPWTQLCLRLGQRYRTANLVAHLAGQRADAALPHLYLVAHYDSKSQPLPLPVRLALFVIAIGGGVVFAVFTLSATVLPLTNQAAVIAGIIALVAGLPLLILRAGNESPGAIDNGSSVGLVLHLAEVLSRDEALRQKLRLTVLIPSAEELSLMGAMAYVREHAEAMRRETSGVYVLNFDGIGVRGKLHVSDVPKVRGGRLGNLVRAACAEAGLPLGRFGLPGVLFDHIPFAERGLDAVSLIVLGRASAAVHTPQDSVDKLNVEGFRQAGLVALKMVEKLAGRSVV